MKVITNERSWNFIYVDIPRLDEKDLDYVTRVLDYIEAFYKKNTSDNPPMQNFLSSERRSLKEGMDFVNQPIEGNLCDMRLTLFESELDMSVRYRVQSAVVREMPTGIHLSCHRDNKRIKHMALIKLLWEDFDPISN